MPKQTTHLAARFAVLEDGVCIHTFACGSGDDYFTQRTLLRANNFATAMAHEEPGREYHVVQILRTVRVTSTLTSVETLYGADQ